MSEDLSAQAQSDLSQLKLATTQLGEHFDTVQIFVTRYEPAEDGGTTNIHYGTGNWFARFGHVRDWIVKREEDAKIERRKDE